MVVRGLLEAEVATGNWTPASLGTQYAGHQVNLAIGNAEQQSNITQLQMEFSQFAAMVENNTQAAQMELAGGVPYLAEVTDQWSKSEVVKEAAEAIVDKSLSRDNPFVMSMMFWMGPRHTITSHASRPMSCASDPPMQRSPNCLWSTFRLRTNRAPRTRHCSSSM